MSAISEIQLFQLLKEKLGEKEAETLVAFVDNRIKEKDEVNLKSLATKEDLVKEISGLETKLLRTIYLVNIVQLLAIVGSVITIIRIMIKM